MGISQIWDGLGKGIQRALDGLQVQIAPGRDRGELLDPFVAEDRAGVGVDVYGVGTCYDQWRASENPMPA